MKDYGKAIKTLRKNVNMTQAQLAERLSVTPQTVSKWENGVNTPDIDAVESLCRLFDITMDEFMRMADGKVASEPETAIEPETIVEPQTTVEQQAVEQTVPVYAAADTVTTVQAVEYTEKRGRIKPIYIALIVVAVLAVVLVSVLVPVLMTRGNSLKKLTASEIYQKVNPSVFYIEVETEDNIIGGSGFFINGLGTAVTNFHVIDGIQSAEVTLCNGKTYAVDKILGVDSVRDIALIHVAVARSTPVTFSDSNGVKTGDKVYAIGYPQSFVLGVQDSTLTEGLVSKAAYNIDGVNYIQSTVDITHGNSGGVLVDEYGRVVGMTTAGIDIGNIDYMNLSVPVNAIKRTKSNVNLSVTEYSVKSTIRYRAVYVIGDDVYDIREISALFEKFPELKPKLTDAEFIGWYEDSGFTTPFDFAKTPESDTIIYGRVRYTGVMFEFSGGTGASGAVASITVETGESLTLPPNLFSLTGYTFVGWNIGGVVYSVGDTVPVSGDALTQTVTAEWQPISYTVSYVYDGETALTEIYTYDLTFRIEQALFTRTGYVQTGWLYNGLEYSFGARVTALTATDGDEATFTPKWSPIQYNLRITFDVPSACFEGINYGTNESSVYAYLRNCTYGSNPLSGRIPSRNYFVFDGWEIYNPDGSVYDGELAYINAANGSTVNARALWTSGNYLLVLGRFASHTRSLSGRQSYSIPRVAELLDGIAGLGYRFVHWQHVDSTSNPAPTYADGATVSDLMQVGYRVVYGSTVEVRLNDVWEPIQYSVRFDGNGGTGSMTTLACTYDREFTLPENAFVRSGYTFVGWQLDGEVYLNGSTVKNLTTEPCEVTLRAKWVEDYEGDGTESSPYLIKDYEGLEALYYFAKVDDYYATRHYYTLSADIDCAGRVLYPIGAERYFSGVFDGAGHVIKNAVFAPAEWDSGRLLFGLFGHVYQGQVKNLGIEEYDFVRGGTGEYDEDGMICAFAAAPLAYEYMSQNPLENCYATTSNRLSFTNLGLRYYSGLVCMLLGNMENCYAACDVDFHVNRAATPFNNVDIGGIVTWMSYESWNDGGEWVSYRGMIARCYTDVNVNIIKTVGGESGTVLHCGLIVAQRGSPIDGNLVDCFSVGSITYDCDKDSAGRLCSDYCIGLISGHGDNYDTVKPRMYVAGRIVFAGGEEANGTVFENQQSAQYSDLCSTEWLSQNLGFDTAVWTDSENGLPTLR